MNKGIAFAGNLIVDNLKFAEKWPVVTGLTTISRQSKALGGLASTCTVCTAILDPDVPVKVVGIVGEDELGDLILSEFSGYPQVDTQFVTRRGETSYTDVITEPDGRRTFFQFRGANALLGPEAFDFAKIDADILHIGYVLLLDTLDGPDPDYPTALCRVLADARKAGILTSVDVVSEDGDRFQKIVTPALAYTDILTINDFEASAVTGIPLRDEAGNLLAENLESCVRTLAAMGVHKWVCVHMPEVAAGIDIETEAYTERKTLKLPEGFICSSVGAGDAFACGLLLGAYHGLSLTEAIDQANAVAAQSLAGDSAAAALKTLPEVLAAMGRFEIPACAGMTEGIAGMTEGIAGMTGVVS
ncbi:MAG: carbohydrate kinase family protein [Clostridiales Family XIII bacterium]|nr:carbohydrate kinase family protein [Clostridiales Family XIII bacterium]